MTGIRTIFTLRNTRVGFPLGGCHIRVWKKKQVGRNVILQILGPEYGIKDSQ